MKKRRVPDIIEEHISVRCRVRVHTRQQLLQQKQQSIQQQQLSAASTDEVEGREMVCTMRNWHMNRNTFRMQHDTELFLRPLPICPTTASHFLPSCCTSTSEVDSVMNNPLDNDEQDLSSSSSSGGDSSAINNTMENATTATGTTSVSPTGVKACVAAVVTGNATATPIATPSATPSVNASTTAIANTKTAMNATATDSHNNPEDSLLQPAEERDETIATSDDHRINNSDSDQFDNNERKSQNGNENKRDNSNDENSNRSNKRNSTRSNKDNNKVTKANNNDTMRRHVLGMNQRKKSGTYTIATRVITRVEIMPYNHVRVTTFHKKRFDFDFDNGNGYDALIGFLELALPPARIVDLSMKKQKKRYSSYHHCYDDDSNRSFLDVEKLTERLTQRSRRETVTEKFRKRVGHVVSSIEELSNIIWENACAGCQLPVKDIQPPPRHIPSGATSSCPWSRHLEMDDDGSYASTVEISSSTHEKRIYLQTCHLPSGLSLELPVERCV